MKNIVPHSLPLEYRLMPEVKRGVDGRDHINVYSQGRTELGRTLSNFARTPFVFDGKTFASVEAWWYYRKTGNYAAVGALHGLEAKRAGQALPTVVPAPPEPALLLKVYQAKCDQTPGLATKLMHNKLPYDHYYVYSGAVRETIWRWTGQLWSKVIP